MNNFALFFFLSDWRFDLKEKTIYYFTRKLWDTLKHLKRIKNLTKRWRVKKISKMKIYIYIHICFFTCRRFFTLFIFFPRYHFTILSHYLNHFFWKQFISIVINLLDALKTSFSHRSLTARSMGRRDTVSEAAVASISMLKVTSILKISPLSFFSFQLVNKFIYSISRFQGYMRSVKSFNNVGRAEDEGQRGCAERALCEASAECVADAQGTSSIFCQLGS